MRNSQRFHQLLTAAGTRPSRPLCRLPFMAGNLSWHIAALALLAAGLHGAKAQSQVANAGERQPALTELTSKLHVGTEFFLNRTETKETVEKHFKLMHENGITVVRIFVIWDDIERTPGHWDLSHYDWIYDAAAKYGMKIAATLCTEDPPGWMDMTTFYHQRANLDNPELRAHAEEYIKQVVGRYKDHPGAGFWLLMNEPTKYHEDKYTFHAFGQWLQKKYGTVEEVNQHWFRPITSFGEVAIDENPDHPNYWLDEEEYLDWKQFNVDNLIANLAWIQSKVLALDAKHPTHFNVTRPIGDSVGQDVWKEERVPDTIGVSMHWTMAPTSPESDYGELYAYKLDQVASASFVEPGKPFWVTELQSGPCIFLGRFPLWITPQDLTRWMWDSYGAGANAVVFWLWHPRDIGTEAGENGLVSLEGQPTVRLPAVKALAEVLDKNTALASEHPQQARVAILYDRQSALINDLDGKWQTRIPGEDSRSEDVPNALKGCYLALIRAHVPVQYVDIDQLKRGEVDKYAVLYAPVDYAMDDATIAALEEYVKQGGTLWADGITGWKNERGKIRATIPGGLTDLFGAEAVEIYPVQPSNPYSVTPQKELGGQLWRLPLVMKGGTVVMRDHDGNPFEITNTYGKGKVYYYTSAVTLAYLLRENPIVHKWILEPALKEVGEMPIQLKQGSDHLLFRGLTGAAGSTAILTNWGETQTASVLFKGVHKVKNAVTGKPVAVTAEHGNTIATLTVHAEDSAVLMTE